jgi:hypothetical protein
MAFVLLHGDLQLFHWKLGAAFAFGPIGIHVSIAFSGKLPYERNRHRVQSNGHCSLQSNKAVITVAASIPFGLTPVQLNEIELPMERWKIIKNAIIETVHNFLQPLLLCYEIRLPTKQSFPSCLTHRAIPQTSLDQDQSQTLLYTVLSLHWLNVLNAMLILPVSCPLRLNILTSISSIENLGIQGIWWSWMVIYRIIKHEQCDTVRGQNLEDWDRTVSQLVNQIGVGPIAIRILARLHDDPRFMMALMQMSIGFGDFYRTMTFAQKIRHL